MDIAEKRMFSREVVESDNFLNLPLSAQGLYMHICMEADDDGFVNNANRIRRVVDASEDDYKILFQNGFLLQMAKGLVVVAHWRICNSIRKDRYKPTVYQSEWEKLKIKDNVYVVDGKEDADLVPAANIPKEITVQKFGEFWEAYPRKEHRAMAETEYAMLVMQGIKEDMLIASAKAYAKDKAEENPKYLNCPDSWLRKNIFADYEVKEPTRENEDSAEEEGEEPAMNLWDGKEEQ